MNMDRMDAAHALLDVSIRQDSGDALEALAALASSSARADMGEEPRDRTSDEDYEAVQLIEEFRRRPRSVSNPEGMEKQCLASSYLSRGPVLETLDEEHELNMDEKPKGMEVTMSLIRALEQKSNSTGNLPNLVKDEEVLMDDRDLLKKARARLLEDLAFGEKGGIMNFPHSMKKYKDIYNKNGFIGIYSPEERTAIISRFQRKRQNRVWNKKIRYNCRKDLADRRLRIKGRFVKRDSEEAKAYMASLAAAKSNLSDAPPALVPESSSSDSSPSSSPPPDSKMVIDETYPDTSDPEAGFVPTSDAPFRRSRRHTVV